MATKTDDLKKQRDQLEMEASIAQSRAIVVESNVRRMKAQMEYAKLRASLASAKK